MKVAHIVPTENLPQIVAYGYHMALAPRLDSDPAYREFYRTLGEWGRFIIVDNGAAEGESMPFDEVLKVAEYIRADEICLPDVLYDRGRTYNLAREWREKVCRASLVWGVAFHII